MRMVITHFTQMKATSFILLSLWYNRVCEFDTGRRFWAPLSFQPLHIRDMYLVKRCSFWVGDQ